MEDGGRILAEKKQPSRTTVIVIGGAVVALGLMVALVIPGVLSSVAGDADIGGFGLIRFAGFLFAGIGAILVFRGLKLPAS